MSKKKNKNDDARAPNTSSNNWGGDYHLAGDVGNP